MGLTIHYELKLSTARRGLDEFEARRAVEAWRKLALKFKRQGRLDSVGKLGFAPADRRYAVEWRMRPVPGQPRAFTEEEIRPLAGHLFQISVGRDCEPLLLGLCRYESGGGWRLQGFSKTQYASLHGWDHFRRCHTAVIDLLAGGQALGLAVEISDEGEYWPGRDLRALQRNLEEMNCVVAAAAGALKDGDQENDGAGVQAPIRAHPHFERLEAEGAARGYASGLRKALAKDELR
jgi:hypothetical protein